MEWAEIRAALAPGDPRPLMLAVPPGPEAHEPEWSKYLARLWGGTAEVVLADGSRVDVLCENVAWEVEWARKWKEAPGQALLYQTLAGRTGGVALLCPRVDDNTKYVLRCAVACASAGLLLRVVETD